MKFKAYFRTKFVHLTTIFTISINHKIVVFVFLISCLFGSAQQYFFKNYSVESGLPFVQVSCTYQDSNGYLWIGGFGGLSRFDGKQFLNYNRKNGLIDHNVNAISADNDGRLFVGTNNGLSVFNGHTFTNYTKQDGLESPRITSFCKGHHHAIYIGTSNGLYMFRNDKISHVKKLDNYKINYLFHPDSTLIYIGTDKGLILYGHNTFKILDVSKGLVSNQVTCITKFRNYLVIGTTKGLSLYNFNTQKFTNYFIESGLIDEAITSLVSQDNECLWVGSQSGLLRFNGFEFSYYNINSDNNSNQVQCISQDREDNIWLGTHSGLYRYHDNSFSTFEKVQGLGTAFVYQIFRDKTGELWVTSQNSGIYRGSENYFKHYSLKDGLSNSNIKAGLETKEGRLIFATAEDLSEFKNEKFHSLKLPEGFRGSYDVLFQSSDHTLWVGGTNGFASLKWKGSKLETKFYPIESKLDFGVYGFCEDKEHNLYIGTFKAGLFKLNAEGLVNLSTQWHLNEETFFTLKYINHQIFAASLNGLLVINLNTKTIKKITDEDGLNSELIYSIEFTKDTKSLWMGTNQGINKLNLEKYLNNAKIELSSYGLKEGFTGVECNTGGIWEDKDGTLWFGTVSGLIKHQPFNFRKNTLENITLIQNIKLRNEDTLIQNGVELPSDHNTISFYYRGICFTNPDKVMYQKKLEGLSQDKDWSPSSAEDYSKYTNLAPGKYTFKVRSCNNEGIWNSKETTFSFSIKQPYYQTWWFILLSALFVFSVIYTIFMLRIYNIKKQQKLDFERKVEMSKIELKALRSQMNPHFIFNSLNSIQHYIFHAQSDEAIKYLNKFARLVRIILNNSEKPTVTVGDDLEALKLYLELEQMRFEEKFDYEIIIDKSVDVDYDIMPPLLMQPYVENAILHGLNPKPVKGKLTIKLNCENNFLI